MNVVFAVIGLILCTITAILSYLSNNMILFVPMVCFSILDIIVIIYNANA